LSAACTAAGDPAASAANTNAAKISLFIFVAISFRRFQSG
jgi:hypothetical protein